MTYFCLDCRQRGRIVAMQDGRCPVCSCQTAVVFMGARNRPDEYAVWPAEHNETEVPVQ